MKLSLCFLALLLAFASCETFSPEIPQTPPGDPHQDVAEFYEGLFSHFGLHKPNQIISECFNNFSAGVFLGKVYTFNQLLIDMNARDFKHVHQDSIKELILSILGHGSADCIVATQDYSDLVEALGVKRDPFFDNVAQYLDYQANFPRLLEDYRPLMQKLNAKDFSGAGAAYGNALNNTVEAVKRGGLSYLSHVAIANGFSFGLDIDLPNDTLGIWNETTAAYAMKFTFESTKAVADGHWWDSYENLIKYYKGKGADVLSKIPVSMWEALKASEDTKKMTEKLGMDTGSKEFEELTTAWIKKHQWKYHAYSKEQLKSLERFDLIHVGTLQADFIWEVVRSK